MGGVRLVVSSARARGGCKIYSFKVSVVLIIQGCFDYWESGLAFFGFFSDFRLLRRKGEELVSFFSFFSDVTGKGFNGL